MGIALLSNNDNANPVVNDPKVLLSNFNNLRRKSR